MNTQPLLREYDVEVCIDGITITLRVEAMDKADARQQAEDKALWMSEKEPPVVRVWCATKVR